MKRISKILFGASMLSIMFLSIFTGCKGGDDPSSPAQGVPVLTTNAVSNITSSTAICGGNITSDGGSAITVRGICWSTNQTPTIADNKTTDGTGNGNFSSNIAGLTNNTTYYVRAYATNSTGIGYGTAKSFIARDTYFGQPVPGETPVLFAQGTLNSLSVWVETAALSPDGTILLAAVGNASYSAGKIYFSRYIDNAWSSFYEVPFISGFVFSNEPVFAADGKSVIFTGRKSMMEAQDLWSVSYINGTWGVPVKLPSPITSNANEFRGSFMTNGTFYFSSGRNIGMNQVYKGTLQPPTAELLGAPINTGSFEGDPCIAPDGHFLVFYSGRSGGSGGTDLYVSFSDGQGGWKTPKNLGSDFNSQYDEYGAYLSSDGKYLFFTRHNAAQRNYLYWVSVSAIEKLN